MGKFTFKKSKRSSEIALRIIWKMLFDTQFKQSKACTEEFIGFEAKVYLAMDLGKHYTN